MNSEIKEIEIIENKFKQLFNQPSEEKILEKGKCISKNIYFNNHTLSIQYHPSSSYLYSFFVKGNIKNRLTLIEFLHKNIVFEKRFGFDKERKQWAELSEQLFNTETYRNSDEIANYFYELFQQTIANKTK